MGNCAHTWHCLATEGAGKFQHWGVMNHSLTTAHKWWFDGKIFTSRSTWNKNCENSADPNWEKQQVFHQQTSSRTKETVPVYRVEYMPLFKNKTQLWWPCLFMILWVGFAPTSTASDIVNECQNMRRSIWKISNGIIKVELNPFRRLEGDSPHCPRSHMLRQAQCVLIKVQRVHVRARSVSGSPVVGVRLVFFLLSP